MNTRDQFALSIIQGVIASDAWTMEPDKLAKHAYKIADEMLKVSATVIDVTVTATGHILASDEGDEQLIKLHKEKALKFLPAKLIVEVKE